MGIQINGNTNNINAGIGSLSIEDLNELDIVGVATASNFKTGVSNLHNVGLTLSGGQIDVGSNIKIGTAGVVTATSFVGSLSGGSVSGTSGAFTGNIDLNSDTNKLKIGAGDDFQFFHNGSNNFIETNNGDIRIKTSDSSGNLTFTAGGSTERVRIKSNGYVGIGTNNPQRLLVLSDDGAAGAEFNIPDNFGGLSLNLYNRTTTGFHPLSFNAADIRLGINAIEKARLASGGQFLIGTTAASGYSNRLLTVNADDGDAHIEIRTANDHAGTISFSDTNAGTSAAYSGYIQYVHSGNHMVFGLSSAEKVRIDNNGNLCVGITGGSAKFHTKGDQSGGLIKCDAAEGTTRFFLTGTDSNACELNMYNNAGTQATIIKAGASNNSTDIHTTQAGGRFRVYVTPLSGRTHQSSIFRPFQIDEYGELRQERGSEGWTSGYYETNNGGVKYHHRHAYTGASSQNVNLIRVRRHYWGAGFYKFIVRQTYYGGSYEAHFWLNGHAANGNTTSFNLTYSNINGGNSNWIQKTATSHSSPGNNYSGWTDVFVSIPVYAYFDIRVETSLMAQHSYDINNIGNDGYALHPFS